MSGNVTVEGGSHFYQRVGFRCLLLFGGCLIAGCASWMIGSTLNPWVPVWLPAGVGFVALLRWGLNYWPMVALGGAIASFFLFIDAETRIERLIGVTSGALGLVVGAAAGALLAQRLVKWPEDLKAGRGTARLVISGGIIGPIASSLIVFPCWWWIGAVPEGASGLFWIIFVLSNAIGVAVLGLPLLMIAPIVEGDWSKRRMLLSIPMPVALVASLALLSFVDGAAKRQIQYRFNISVSAVNSLIQEQLIQHLEMLHSMRSFWESSDWVSRTEFRQFTKRGLKRNEGLVLLGWAPEMTTSDSVQFSSALTALSEGSVREGIPEWFSGGGDSSFEADVMFPLWYLVPREVQGRWIGSDLYRDDLLRDVMEKSRNDGSITAAAPVVAGINEHHLFFSSLWVPEKRVAASPDDEWLQNRGGYVVSLIDLETIAAEAIQSAGEIGAEDFVLTVQSESGERGEIVYRREGEESGLREYERIMTIAFADRLWQTRYVPLTGVFGNFLDWQVPSAQAGVFLVTSLLGILLLTGTGYAVRIENEVKDRTQELGESEERFRQLSETVSEVFWIFSVVDSRFEYVSPAFERVWLEPLDAVCKDPYVWYYKIRELDRKEAREAFETALSGRGEYDVEYCIVRKDGEERWIRDRGFPVRDKDGNVRRIVGVADDVSETRKAQQELLRSNADLERFAYLASHDLQEPLRMVTSFVQLLQKRYEGELGSDADEYISHAVSGAERMRRLINGLLALSRVDSRDLKAERVSSNVLVRDAIDDLQVAIEESGAKVKVGGNLPAVYGAKAQLTQVFQNLISNAIKYASPDRPPEIRVTARDRDGMVEFSVSDNGPGIAEKDFERIFEIFQRLEKGQDEKGTGIGLSLCRRIVERHGGKMWVKSESGEGSSFIFTIPLQSTLPAENPA